MRWRSSSGRQKLPGASSCFELAQVLGQFGRSGQARAWLIRVFESKDLGVQSLARKRERPLLMVRTVVIRIVSAIPNER